MSDIPKRLRASVKFDAINGTVHERAICGRQMLEAAREIERLQAENDELRAKVAERPTCEHCGSLISAERQHAIDVLLDILGRAKDVKFGERGSEHSPAAVLGYTTGAVSSLIRRLGGEEQMQARCEPHEWMSSPTQPGLGTWCRNCHMTRPESAEPLVPQQNTGANP